MIVPVVFSCITAEDESDLMRVFEFFLQNMRAKANTVIKITSDSKHTHRQKLIISVYFSPDLREINTDKSVRHIS